MRGCPRPRQRVFPDSYRTPSAGPFRLHFRLHFRLRLHRPPAPDGRIRGAVRGIAGPPWHPWTMPPVSPFLRTAASYAWRLLVVGAAVYAVFALLGRFHEIAVAVFLGLVVTALLWVPTRHLARAVPRTIAVALGLMGSALILLGVLTLVGEAVAGESTTLAREFREGLASIEAWLEKPPSG